MALGGEGKCMRLSRVEKYAARYLVIAMIAIVGIGLVTCCWKSLSTGNSTFLRTAAAFFGDGNPPEAELLLAEYGWRVSSRDGEYCLDHDGIGQVHFTAECAAQVSADTDLAKELAKLVVDKMHARLVQAGGQQSGVLADSASVTRRGFAYELFGKVGLVDVLVARVPSRSDQECCYLLYITIVER